MDEMSDRLMADFACLDPVYVDGIAGLMNLGANFGTLYYRWKAVCSNRNGLVYEKQPALVIIRPKTSIPCPTCPVIAEIVGSAGPLRGLN